MLRVGALVLALASSLLAPRVLACATCGAGDPTLTLAGTEQPFAGRVRTSVSTTASGTIDDGDRVSDQRVAIGVAWAPAAWAMLSATAPFVLRTPAGASSVAGPGDLDLRGRFVVLRDRSFAPTHLVTFQIGARFPLVSRLSDSAGMALDASLQSASPTVSPMAGLAWSVYAAPFSLQTYVLTFVPLRGSDGIQHPIELRASSLAIVQAVPVLSFVLGPEVRAHVDGVGSEGGAVLFGTVGAMLRAGDVTPYLLVRVPLATHFDDGHTELPALEAGAAIDL